MLCIHIFNPRRRYDFKIIKLVDRRFLAFFHFSAAVIWVFHLTGQSQRNLVCFLYCIIADLLLNSAIKNDMFSLFCFLFQNILIRSCCLSWYVHEFSGIETSVSSDSTIFPCTDSETPSFQNQILHSNAAGLLHVRTRPFLPWSFASAITLLKESSQRSRGSGMPGAYWHQISSAMLKYPPDAWMHSHTFHLSSLPDLAFPSTNAINVSSSNISQKWSILNVKVSAQIPLCCRLCFYRKTLFFYCRN